MRSDLTTATAARVTVLSERRNVHMADEWFDLATLEHFWIKRRFAVCARLLNDLPVGSFKVGEVGCGSGLVQRQFEDHWQIAVDGFDLNMEVLEHSVSRRGSLYHYDILEKQPEFKARYDLIILFDVLEHVSEEKPFLQSVFFHLKQDGVLLLNVPADPRLYSPYDVVSGHARRYTSTALKELAGRCQLQIKRWTYWGLPLYPLLMLRKIVLRRTPPSRIIATGFSPPGEIANFALQALAAVEPIPQYIGGTSLMAILTRQTPDR